LTYYYSIRNITVIPKFDLPKMPTSEVIGIQSSRFPVIYSSMESHRSIYPPKRPWDVELKLVAPLL